MISGPDSPAPLVGVGMPVHAASATIATALRCIMEQSHDRLDVLVWDNASTDRTSEIAASVAADDDRVQIRQRRENVGAVRNFNDVFHATNGPFFMWAAHDDRWDRDFVARCLEELGAHPEAGLCICATRLVDRDDQEIGTAPADRRLQSDDVATRARGFLRSRPGWYQIYGLMRRAALEETGLFRSVWGPDVLVVWELLLRRPARTLDQVLFTYTVGYDKSIDERAASLIAHGDHRLGGFVHLQLWVELWRAAQRLLPDRRRRWQVQLELLKALGTRPWMGRLRRDLLAVTRARARR